MNCLRFSPDGNKVVTVGSDKKGFIYDGKEGTKLGELSETNGHSGSIYSVAWSPDSSKFVTASVDKSVKVWYVRCGVGPQFTHLRQGMAKEKCWEHLAALAMMSTTSNWVVCGKIIPLCPSHSTVHSLCWTITTLDRQRR